MTTKTRNVEVALTFCLRRRGDASNGVPVPAPTTKTFQVPANDDDTIEAIWAKGKNGALRMAVEDAGLDPSAHYAEEIDCTLTTSIREAL